MSLKYIVYLKYLWRYEPKCLINCFLTNSRGFVTSLLDRWAQVSAPMLIFFLPDFQSILRRKAALKTVSSEVNQQKTQLQCVTLYADYAAVLLLISWSSFGVISSAKEWSQFQMKFQKFDIPQNKSWHDQMNPNLSGCENTPDAQQHRETGNAHHICMELLPEPANLPESGWGESEEGKGRERKQRCWREAGLWS